MDIPALLLIELAAVVALSILARRISVAQPVVLVLGGLLLGLVPEVPALAIGPEEVLLIFLPPILFPSAAEYAREDVVPALQAIGLLSVGLVLLTAGVVAAVGHAMLGLDWGPALALGALLAPTDPVSATAVLRSAGAPPQIATILEGESLINDGTSLTLLRVAIGMVGASVGLGDAVLQFVGIAFGGALLGLVLGWITSEALRLLDDVEIESAIAVLAAYGSYVLAEHFGVSGILCTVLTGYVVGRRRSVIHSPETRLGAGSFWELLQFMSVSLLFVLVGSEVAAVIGDFDGGEIGKLALTVLAVSVAAMATRLVWMLVVPPLVGLFDTKGTRKPSGLGERIVLVLGGMRGAISVAGALSIPLTVDGAVVHDRDAIVVVALASVVVLLVLPALALPWTLRRLGVSEPGAHELLLSQAKQSMLSAALGEARAMRTRQDADEELLGRAVKTYEARLAAEQDDERDATSASGRVHAYAQLLLKLLDVERAELSRLQRDGEIAGAALSELERELDIDSQRLERR